MARLKRKYHFRTYDDLLRNDYGLPVKHKNYQQTPETEDDVVIECPHCDKEIIKASINAAKRDGKNTFKCYHCDKPIDITNWEAE